MKPITSRKFFSSLYFADPDTMNHRCSDELVKLDAPPIFTLAELENEPLKWLKYLLLARLNLRSSSQLTEEIQRYPFGHWRLARDQCEKLLINANEQEQSNLIVIKLVPMDKAGQLRNFRLYHLDKINEVFKQILEVRSTTEVELWICQSIVKVETLSLAGRLTLPIHRSFGPTFLEVVWYTSPRLLENINITTFAYPYLRATRQVGKLLYKIEKLHIPEAYSFSEEVFTSRFIKDFLWLVNKINLYKEKIRMLEGIFAPMGVNELSLEFKSDNGYFQFIDWDTAIEVSGRIK